MSCPPIANRSSGSTSRKSPRRPKAKTCCRSPCARASLFYRPAALRDGDASLARNSLKWAVTTSADGKGAVLKVANPTPYHVTFTGFRINKGQQDINTEMLPPMAEQSYPLKAIKTPQAVTVTYTTINDYGGETALKW